MKQREIKFRVWNMNSEEFVPPSEIRISAAGLIEGDDGREWVETTSDVNVFQQFTGLKDKNGKEIYEGDIIKIESNKRHPEYVGYVCWDLNGCCFEIIIENDWMPLENTNEVIGNIYENPELLKNK